MPSRKVQSTHILIYISNVYTIILFSNASHMLNSYEHKPSLNTLRKMMEKIKTIINKINADSTSLKPFFKTWCFKNTIQLSQNVLDMMHRHINVTNFHHNI